MPAKEVADDYRSQEERAMVTEGVMKGRYELYDVAKTEE
jgi:hypothetical protein